MKTPRNSQAGFTVVELLTTIVIISVLGALLMSTLNKGIKAGQKTNCASNVRETSKAIHLYAVDHDNTLPGPFTSQSYSPGYKDTPGGTPGSYGLYHYIWSYAGLPEAGDTSKLARIGICPVVKGKKESWLRNSKFFTTQVHYNVPDENATCVIYPVWKELPQGNGRLQGYPFGANGDSTDPNDPPVQPWKINSVPQPSKLALLSEIPGNPANPTRFADDDFPRIYDTHCNILFLDGHIETRAKHQKIDPVNPRVP